RKAGLEFHACAGCLSRNFHGKLLKMQFLQGASPWSPQILLAPTCTRRGFIFWPPDSTIWTAVLLKPHVVDVSVPALGWALSNRVYPSPAKALPSGPASKRVSH